MSPNFVFAASLRSPYFDRMSSPVSHLACGYAIYRIVSARNPQATGLSKAAQLAVAAVFSLMPDLDFVAGWIAGDFPGYHNNISHSFAFGALTCLVLAALATSLRRSVCFLPLWGFTYACYAAHIAVDYVTHGRGVMLFWPFLQERFASPIILFGGVRWAKGLWTTDHFLTLANDAVFAIVVIALAEWAARRWPQTT